MEKILPHLTWLSGLLLLFISVFIIPDTHYEHFTADTVAREYSQRKFSDKLAIAGLGLFLGGVVWVGGRRITQCSAGKQEAKKVMINILGCSTAVFAVYVGLFSSWWFKSPVINKTIAGQQIRIVEFQFNTISYYTQIIWLPAFWWIENIGGYRKGGFVPLEEYSVIEYVK